MTGSVVSEDVVKEGGDLDEENKSPREDETKSTLEEQKTTPEKTTPEQILSERKPSVVTEPAPAVSDF